MTKIGFRKTDKSLRMDKLRLYFKIFLFLSLGSSGLLNAQDNLRINYSSAATVPNFLNVCGDTDDVTVRISVNGTATDERENITATLHLFDGLEFENFVAANSSTGVSLVDGSDPGNPIFSLPNLSPFGVTSVEINFTMTANCGILDTININNNVSIFDTWDLEYEMAGTSLLETETTSEYRDALAIAFFSVDIQSPEGPFQRGDCYTRDILITNSGLDGFTDNLEYTVTQGAGASISAIRINGIPANLIKLLDPMTGDTIITVSMGGTEFQGNTIGGGAGNGDGFIDPSETVTVSEDICVIECDARRESTHGATWGCLNQICDSVETSDFVRVGEGSPNPILTPGGVTPLQDVGYCQEGTTSITVMNDGVALDPGFGSMLDLELAIGMGSAFDISDNGFSITSYTVAGVSVPLAGPTIILNNNPAFAVDPDGAGGLSDFDGDGFFDDLELGELVEIAATYEFDCSLAQSTLDNCINDFSTFFTARVVYDDACSVDNSRVRNSYLRPSNINSDIEDFSSPDAETLGPVFYVTHTESRSVRLFEKNCGGAEFFRATVTLPDGINPVIAETALFKNQSSTPIPLVNNTLTGNTLELLFDASIDNFLNGNYELIMAFEADCDATVGPSTFPFTFEFICPSCNCEHLWYCSNIDGPFIHKDVPPCPPDPDVICAVGLKTTGFDANRTSFGYTDANYTTPFNPADANVKVAVSCDSVEMVITSEVGDTPISGPIGFEVNYGNIDGTTDPEQIFNFSSGVVEIVSGGANYSCPVTAADMTTNQMGSTNIVRFDLPNCLSDLGIVLQPGDELTFTGDFTVNPDGPYEVQFKKVPNFRAWGFANVAGVDEFCETYGDIFTVAKTNTLFAFPNSNNFPEGCEETFLNYQVISVFNDFPKYYGDEFYPSIRVDSVKFTFDPAILTAFTLVEPMVSIPGHPVFGNDFFPVPGFEDFSNGDYVAYFDTLNVVPSLNQVRSYSFNFRVRVIPNCTSIFGSSNGDNTFNFDPEIFYQNRYYANTIGDPNCVDFVVDQVDNDMTYDEPPTFSFNPITNPNFILIGDTAVWDVKLCNTSFESDAGITWFSIENLDDDIVVHSMEDISDPNNVQNLSFSTYGTNGYNVFSFTDGLSKSDPASNPEDICNTIRVKATVERCGELFLKAKSGWSCIPYDDPNWNPEDYPPCDDLELDLSISTRDPFLDANVSVQPDPDLGICAPNNVTILIRNNDLGAAFDVNSTFILPNGVTFLPGTFEIAYPSDAAFVSIPTDPTFVQLTAMGNEYSYGDFAPLNAFLDENGLPGFDPNDPSTNNEFSIRFEFTTDCDFTSGSLVNYTFQGRKGCQDPTNLEAGETLPITINGSFAGGLKLFDIDFTMGTALIPGATANMEINIENLTNTPSSATGDRISFTLPPGVNYIAGSTVVNAPASWTPGEPAVTVIAGQEILEWQLPDGLLLGDVANLGFQLSTVDLDCDVTSLDGILVILSGQDFVCVNDNSLCAGNAITSSNMGLPITIPVQQGVLTFDVSNNTSVCVDGTTETVTIAGNIVNGATAFPATPFNIDYYTDTNENGILDPTDAFVSTFTENGPIPANGSIAFNHVFDADVSEVCNLILSVDVSAILNNDCGVTQIFFDEPALQNAGADAVLCTNAGTVNVDLGNAGCGTANYTYEWSAVAPADINNLSATDIADPTFTIDMSTVTETAFVYVLTTQRTNCGTTRDSITFTVEGPPTVGITADANAACPGFPIVLTGNGADTYMWMQAGNNLGTGNTITVNPTQATTYTVVGVDANGCENTADINIGVDANLCPCDFAEVSTIVAMMATCGNNDGMATVNITGNPADYSYVWTPDLGLSTGAGETRTGLPFGGYQVSIVSNEDANCTTEASVFVTNEDGPEANYTSTPASCDAADGTATLLPADFNYSWPDGSSSNDRIDLTSGTYFVTFSDPAEPDCPNVIMVLVQEDNPLEAEASIGDQPDCGMANGVAEVIPSGGSGNYTFLWTDGSTNPFRNDLESGVYAVTITDTDLGCELPFLFILIDDVPPSTLSIDQVNDISCFGLEDGGIDYSINFDAAFTAEADTTITNGFSTFVNGELSAGTYCIEIRDGNGCVSGGDCFTIEEPDELFAMIETSPDCGGTGSFAVTPFGGTPGYTFDWADLPGTDNSSFRQNLSAGTYGLTIADQNGCLVEESAIDILACPCENIEISSTAIVESTCGNAEGQAVVNMTNDPSTLVYTWSPDLGTPGAAGNQRLDLPAGQYFVTISDPNSSRCDVVTDLLITNSDGPDATYTSTPATCSLNDGTATMDPSSLNYLWPDGFAGELRTDLLSGSYIVTITDPNSPSCENLIEVIVDEDNPLLADVTVIAQPDCGEANGSIAINPSGTTGPYDYAWPDGGTGSSRTNLAAGFYVVTITDLGNSGCQLPFLFVLTDNVASAAVTLSEVMDVSCFGQSDGGITFDVTFDPAFVAPGDTVISDGFFIYENGFLPAGSYCMAILDANGCYAGEECFIIEEPDPLSLSFVIEPACVTGGAINVFVEGGSPAYIYDWEDLPNTNDDMNRIALTAGTYAITIVDQNDCLISENNVVVPVCDENDCDYFNGQEVVSITAASCTSSEEICLGVNLDQLINYTITLDNQPFAGNVEACSADAALAAITLPVGVYSLELRNIFTNCADVLSIDINCVTDCDYFFGETTTVVSSLAACEDEAELCIDIAQADIADYAILVDGVAYAGNIIECSAQAGNIAIQLTAGNHQVTVTNLTNDCSDVLTVSVECSECDYFFGQETTLVSSLEACDNQGELCIDLTQADLNDYSISVNGQAYAGNVESCSTDPNSIAILLPVGTHVILVTNIVNSCSDELTVTVECADCDYFFGQETTTVSSLEACNDLGELCVELSQADLNDFSITVNDEPYAGNIVMCATNPDNVAIQLPVGNHVVVVTNSVNDCSDEITVTVECAECDYFLGQDNVTIESSEACSDEGELCIGISQGDLNNYSIVVDGQAYAGLTINCSTDPNNIAIQLSQGNHEVVVTDLLNNCADTLNAEVICEECDFFFGQSTLEINNEDACDGSAEVCLGIGNAVLGNFEITVDDVPYAGNVGECSTDVDFLAIDVEVGQHTIILTDTESNCADTLEVNIQCSECDFFFGESEIEIELTEACEEGTEFCIDIPFEELGEYEVLLNGAAYNGDIGQCMVDSFGGYPVTGFFGPNSEPPYQISAWEVGDSTYTGNFTSLDGLVDLMNELDPMGNWELFGDPAVGFIKGGTMGIDYGQLTLTQGLLNLPTSFGYADAQDPMGFTIKLDTGFHEIIITDMASGCMDTAFVSVTCAEVECELFGGISDTTIVGTSCEAMNEFCFEGFRRDSFLTFDVFVDSTALVDEDVFNCDVIERYGYPIFQVNENTGPFELLGWQIDDVLVTGTFNSPEELVELMNDNDPDITWGFDPTGNFIEAFGTSKDYGEMSIRTALGVEFSLFGSGSDFDALSTLIFLDTGFHEIVLIDPISGCADTLDVFVDPSMLQCDIVFDTIMINDTVTFCIDTMALEGLGEIVSIQNVCDSLSGESVIFEVDSNYCVTYTGIALGVDTACIEICDTAGICDTTLFVITVIHPSEVVKDTIFPGDIVTYCLDTSIFVGTMFSIENDCFDQSDGEVDFYIDEINYCVEYSGIVSGVDSACVIICDDLGYCDTTNFCIFVQDIDGPPVAVDDMDTTIINTPKVINFKTNDSIFGNLDTVFLVSDPIYGEATINLDCSLTYDPFDDFCDVTDQFDYAICNEFGCDTATIFIYIDCQGEIIIYTALSPNGDGSNDVFFIGGIDFYPNNRLCIFNRWGNQVHVERGYSNTWRGTWNDKDLPDGTYYYILELNDDENRILKGFFELYR